MLYRPRCAFFFINTDISQTEISELISIVPSPSRRPILNTISFKHSIAAAAPVQQTRQKYKPGQIDKCSTHGAGPQQTLSGVPGWRRRGTSILDCWYRSTVNGATLLACRIYPPAVGGDSAPAVLTPPQPDTPPAESVRSPRRRARRGGARRLHPGGR